MAFIKVKLSKVVGWILLIPILAMIGCSQSKSSYNEDLCNLLSEYIGRELVLPPDSICSLMDRDYGLDFIDADYIILSYIDSKGCTPCHLHLAYWDALSDRLDTLSNVFATCVLIIKPDTLEKVTEFIRRSNYTHPVIIDTLGNLYKMNSMPKSHALHTFLIDKNHTVLGLGNPVENTAIDRLYMQIICGENSNVNEYSQLSVTNNTFDVGTVKPGARREFEFIISNSSTDTITVSSIMIPCNCISATATDVMPTSIGTIKITFQANSLSEIFHYPVVVRYDGVKKPIIVHLYGMVSL